MKRLFNSILAISGLVIVALAGGCTASSVDDLDADSDADVDEAQLEVKEAVAQSDCFAGVWIESTVQCNCIVAGSPDYTQECQAQDCRQSDILLLGAQNAAVRAKVRYSALEGRMSAFRRNVDGTWKADTGKLLVSFIGDGSYAPAKCSASSLAEGAQISAQRADQALTASVTLAAQKQSWLDVPYQP